MNPPAFNHRGVWSDLTASRWRASRAPLLQSVVTPVISTSLYFVVFGSADRRAHVARGRRPLRRAFIVLTSSCCRCSRPASPDASFGIYFPKFTGTIHELLSAPVSFFEMIIGYVGAAVAEVPILLGLIILGTAACFVPIQIRHPATMIAFLLLTAPPSNSSASSSAYGRRASSSCSSSPRSS